MTQQEAIDYLLDPIGKRDQHDEAINMAIGALEKQIPKKTIKGIDLSASYDLYILYCPTCGNYIAYGNSRVGSLNKISAKHNVCGYCGQAIDWTEGEATN